MAAPQVSAAQAIGEYLQSPDDLMKVSAFRKKLEKERASIDARLKSGVKEQLDATREGLTKLLGTRNNVQVIKEEMQTVDRMCSDPQNVISTFDQISRVSMVHRNFEQTEEMVNNLLEINSKLDILEELLDADSRDIIGPAPNLLPIHFHINRLEAFRNQTMHQAKKASAASRHKLARMFERLNKLSEDFEAYLLELARNVLPLVRAGYPQVVVKLIKIVELEGREDEKAIAIRLVKKAAKLDAASKFKSMQANARLIKHYRSKTTKAISDSIKANFDDAYTRHQRDPGAFLGGLGWIYQDLIRIESDVVPCFPPSYEIHTFYIKEYHRTLNATLQRVIDSEPDASIMLDLHAWIKEYKKSMKELNVAPELLDPPLLGGEEQNLIEDYLKLIVKKLDEWSANLMKTEIQEFTTRSEPPEVDSDGMYGTQGAVILFQMVNQQIDAATESGQGAILARVVSEVNRVMRSIQDQWTKVVETELKKQTEKPEEVVGGLAEYCIALANDQIKSADNTEALLGRLEPLVSEKYRTPINEKLNDAIDGNLDVAKKCIQTFIDIILNDLKPATKQLFQPPWYDGIMEQIVLTMRDYMADQSYINPSLLELLVEYLLDAFLVTYLTALANCPKLRIPAATGRIKEDISTVFSFFSGFKPAKELEPYFEVVEMILAMLEASKSMAFLSFWAFAKVHGPCIPFVEGLMKARGDFDRSAANEVMDSIKRKVKDEGLADPPEPTIMKKIAVQSTLSRFLRT
ncbi:exocyst complex component Sec6-domain-containing protein [Suillus paluster]|uniref:exocyst complex component Sec6-domain-containing protein n=1 Tax=Suillus paluster TaxID=48578 RepID=UPI001B865469|nr:exocyst complex component Sec6-domain-containing protein [Suillus paluster]KAG1717333.1 exocyst complex component Sec6-domain-containing protein [Suillus paluster]